MVAQFMETPRFPGCPSYGFQSDPEYSVSITRTASGYEKRNQNWSRPLQKMTVTIGPRYRSDIEIVHEFYHAVRGKTIGFRVKDYTDYRSCFLDVAASATDQPLVQLPDSPAFYQMVKRYAYGFDVDTNPIYVDRPIYKPIAPVLLADNGVSKTEGVHYVVDYTRGTVDLSFTPAGTLTWGGEFDIPMRFDSSFPVEIENLRIHSVTFALQELPDAGRHRVKNFPTDYLSAILKDCTTLAACWRVIRRDGVELLGTEHDESIVLESGVLGGVYSARAGFTGSDSRSTADMSVDNMEAAGMLQSIDVAIDINASDIEAGLFDDADVTTFIVNYEDPDAHQDILRVGYMGNVSRMAEGSWRAEVRGLTQALSQGIVRTYSVGCDAELGDARCKVDMLPHTFTGDIATVVVARREFTINFDTSGPPAAGRLIAGKLTMTSGLNAGYSKEVRADTPNLRVFDKFPRDVLAGDTFSVTAGCQKRLIEDCQTIYDNVLNFRGHGVFVPGDTALLKVGKK